MPAPARQRIAARLAAGALVASAGVAAPVALASVSPGLSVPLVPPVAAPRPKAALVRARVPPGSRIGAPELERLAGDAQARIAQRLGVAVPSLTIRLHGSIDTFRRATGQPWWVSAFVHGGEIDLAPAAVLDQRDGLARAVERAVAEASVAPAFDGRPIWVRVGAARYFTGGEHPADGRARCPADADLTAAVSAAAQREAESRAEACFAHAMTRTGDWREIR
jgi:hypothetical protein